MDLIWHRQEPPAPDPYQECRDRMVAEHLAGRDIRDPRVLCAMRSVPRHLFVPEHLREYAYDDHPLSIGFGQTISQPYIVALMTQLLALTPASRVLEIGTGCGYQTAILALLCAEVYTVEIIPELANLAARTLAAHGSENIHLRVGDGYLGWPEAAPFDGVVVAAAPAQIPPPLTDQLKIGGRLVIPVGTHYQELKLCSRTPDGIAVEESIPVRFVPMTGRAAEGTAQT